MSSEKSHFFDTSFFCCHLCGKKEKTMKYCSRCFYTTYCSKECQIIDWPKHKTICKEKQDLKINDKQRKIIKNFLKYKEKNIEKYEGHNLKYFNGWLAYYSTDTLNKLYSSLVDWDIQFIYGTTLITFDKNKKITNPRCDIKLLKTEHNIFRKIAFNIDLKDIETAVTEKIKKHSLHTSKTIVFLFESENIYCVFCIFMNKINDNLHLSTDLFYYDTQDKKIVDK